MIRRIDEEQKELVLRIDRVHRGLNDLSREVSEIKGSIRPPTETPAWIRFFVYPLCVLVAASTVGAVIHLEIALASITRNVTMMRGDLAKQNLSTDAALSPADLKADLTNLTSALETVRQHKLVVPQGVVKNLGKNLADIDSDVPGLWPAASEFITYRSHLLAEWRTTNLPPCLVGRPGQSGRFTAKTVHGSKVITHGPVEYNNCTIVLDSVAATAELSMDLSFADVVCNHCVVIYNGGQIVVIPTKIGAETSAQLIGKLNFNDCLFIFSFPTIPTQQGQQLARTLLTASTNTVIFQLLNQG